MDYSAILPSAIFSQDYSASKLKFTFSSSHVEYTTPEQLRPFEKAVSRARTNKEKKKRKSAIPTDTPVKAL